jgi:hypothetical protein
VQPPNVLDYATAPELDHAAVPRGAARISLACCGLFLLYMTGLFDQSALLLLVPPPLGVVAAIIGLVQSCLRRSDPTPAALGLVLNIACGAFVAYTLFVD